MNISIAIGDADREYVERLSEVLQQYHDLTLSFFTNFDSLQKALEQKQFDILLFDPDISQERLTVSGVKLAVCFYRDSCSNLHMYANCAKVLKYQRVSNIYKDILREYADKAGGAEEFGNRMKTRLIGVYSPVGGSGKTTIALAIACRLKALGNQVLFVNTEQLESSSIVNTHDEDSMAMLIEDSGNEKVNFKVKLTAVSKHGLDDMEYLEGFTKLVDYDAVTGEEIARVLERIKKESDYQYVVIDMDSHLDPVNRAVFQLADQIILVERPGELPVRKIELFAQQVFAQEYKNKMFRVWNFAESQSIYSNELEVPVIGKVHHYGNLKLESMVHAINANGEYMIDTLLNESAV